MAERQKRRVDKVPFLSAISFLNMIQKFWEGVEIQRERNAAVFVMACGKEGMPSPLLSSLEDARTLGIRQQCSAFCCLARVESHHAPRSPNLFPAVTPKSM